MSIKEMKYYVFDDVLCINLDHRPDRWENVQKDFFPVGMKITRIPGVYGKGLSRKVLGNYTSKGCKNFCPKSAIGCAMGHRNAWQTIVDRNLHSALILEDDAYPLPDFEEKLKRVWSQVPSDWDIVFLGGNTRNLPWILGKMGAKRNKFISKNVMDPAFPLAAHAYAVSNKGAKKILNLTNPIRYHIDFHLAVLHQKNRDINIYSLKPELIKQIEDTDYSDNQFSMSKGLDKMLNKISIDDKKLGVMFNTCIFSIGDYDFTANRIILLLLLILLFGLLFKKMKKKY